MEKDGRWKITPTVIETENEKKTSKYRMWKREEQKKKIPSLKSQLANDVEAVVASSTGRWGRNFLDHSEQRGRAGKGCRREGKRELGAERERERERIKRRGRGKEREASGEGEGKGEKREQKHQSEWRVRGKGRAVKPGAPERVEGERDRESSETGAPERKGGKSLD